MGQQYKVDRRHIKFRFGGNAIDICFYWAAEIAENREEKRKCQLIELIVYSISFIFCFILRSMEVVLKIEQVSSQVEIYILLK